MLAGQGGDVATRVQATRDGTPGRQDATYVLAYLSAPQAVTLNTAVIAARRLSAYWFNPANGSTAAIRGISPTPAPWPWSRARQAATGSWWSRMRGSVIRGPEGAGSCQYPAWRNHSTHCWLVGGWRMCFSPGHPL